MDTITSSIPGLKVSVLHSTPTHRELHHFKTHQLPSHLINSKPNSNSISNRSPSHQSFFFNNNLNNSPLFSAPLNSSSNTHRHPASGYAAALLDIAQSNTSLEAVEKDVQRLLKLLQNDQIQDFLADPFVGEKEKGQVVKDVAKRGNFNRILVGLVKMLVERDKVGMVREVLMEFERIYDELCGTRVVLISSRKKMREDELFGIAKRVQKLSGAMKVRVKNLVDENYLPSFAA